MPDFHFQKIDRNVLRRQSGFLGGFAFDSQPWNRLAGSEIDTFRQSLDEDGNPHRTPPLMTIRFSNILCKER